MTLPPPGWFPDPHEPTRQRYWNGERWTDDFAPHPPGYLAPPPPGSFAGPPGYFIPAQMGMRTAPFENARGLANATIVLLAITALLSIASVFVYLDRASLITDLLGDAGSVSSSDVQSADNRVRAFALLGLASYVVTGIVFVVWFQRCYKNSQALGASNLRFSSGWAAGAWFVPFLNLVRPKQIADDIWKSTDPDAPAMQNSSWMAARVPGFLHAWWAFFITGAVVSRIVASLANDYDSLSELRTLDRISAVAEIVTMVGAILAALVVRAMTARGELRAKNLGVAT
jgi:eukaryotic-like serine/threonine-protein kinase